MENNIKITFLGDMMFGGEYLSYIQKYNNDVMYPFIEINEYLNKSDILLINIEGPLFKSENQRPNVTSLLYNHPSLIKFLKTNNICVAVMANNHVMDFGKEGLSYSIDLLRENGIFTVGAGLNEEEANRPLIVNCKGKKMGFLAFTSDEPHIGSIIARGEEPGCASYENLEGMKKKIAYMKRQADIILVSLHWGHEYFHYPSPDQQKIAREIVDAGANFIVGHHPHVIQGIERYKKSLIIYSLGNLFFPPFRTSGGRINIVKKKTREYILFNTEIDISGNIGYSYLGGKVDDRFRMNMYCNNDKEIFEKFISSISNALQSNAYSEFWENYKINRELELRREELYDAFRKICQMNPIDILRTITFDDVRRNILRAKMFFHN